MMTDAFSLKDKTILVTGASSGIGRSCAIECSKAGATVFAFGRNKERLQETLDSLKNEGRSVSVDLNDTEAVDSVMENLESEGIAIDGVIHCAGISTTLPLRMISPEKIQPLFETNVTSAIYLTKWATKNKFLPKNGSSIVFISSVMGSVGESGKTIYSLTKGAVLAAARSMAVELAPKSVRVNCISPGVVESPMSENAVYSRNKEARSKIEALHPLGMGKPEDVAYASIYLLSNASKWVTGTNLFVDGGYTAH
ncbi:MAG: SDR family oxidoreductase [Balneolaceae bacterium]|nr:SDR family oxidoreductase [Balneolaceae bacterium]